MADTPAAFAYHVLVDGRSAEPSDLVALGDVRVVRRVNPVVRQRPCHILVPAEYEYPVST